MHRLGERVERDPVGVRDVQQLGDHARKPGPGAEGGDQLLPVLGWKLGVPLEVPEDAARQFGVLVEHPPQPPVQPPVGL